MLKSVYRVKLPQNAANALKSPSRTFSASASRSKERLVILGSGWGGYEVLRKVDKRKYVTMLSANTYFAFTPLLASCAVGTLEYRTALESVRAFTPPAHAYQAWCDSIDFKNKLLECTPATPVTLHESMDKGKEPSGLSDDRGNAIVGPKFTIGYDKLVIAVGAYAQTFGIPGVKEHGFFLKDLRDARAIRTRILALFGEANLPVHSDIARRKLLHFCIVGGGPTGVEFAAELHDLLNAELKRAFPHLAPMARITLYDVAPQILGSFDQSLVEYATERFRRNGITIRPEHHVEKVEKGILRLKEQGDVPFGLLVWSTGLAPNPLINSISELKKDEKTGGLIVNDNLNVLTKDDQKVMEDIWAIGDAAVIDSGRLPATAQVAYQEAKYISKRLNALAKGKTPEKKFEFTNLGNLAYLGDWRAIYDRTRVASGPKTKETGRLAWLLWRSAYFSMSLSWRNKILVPVYWFTNWIFGRDISRF